MNYRRTNNDELQQSNRLEIPFSEGWQNILVEFPPLQ